MLDLGSIRLNQNDLCEMELTNIGVDTDSGKTVWPEDAICWRQIAGENVSNFSTATGEIAQSGPRLCVDGRDDGGPRSQGVARHPLSASRFFLIASAYRRVSCCHVR